ncbi:hypothetical protein [Streptomyces avidinii]
MPEVVAQVYVVDAGRFHEGAPGRVHHDGAVVQDPGQGARQDHRVQPDPVEVPSGTAEQGQVEQGAAITAVNGEAVSSFPELCDVLEPAEPGAKLSVEGIHSGAGRDSGHRFGGPWTADVVLAGAGR